MKVKNSSKVLIDSLESQWANLSVDNDVSAADIIGVIEPKKDSTRKTWEDLMKCGGYLRVWKSFERFKSDMGFKPFKSKLTKKDFSKPHGPENSYWKRAA